MGRGKQLSSEEKAKIDAYNEENVSAMKIASRIGRSQHVVSNYLRNS